MTDAPGSTGRAGTESSVLARLVGDAAGFAERVWGVEPHLFRSPDGPDAYADLFDLAAVDDLTSRRGLRAPFLRVAKDGDTLPDRAFTTGGGVGAAVADQVSDDALARLFADGHTLVLQGLHRVWPPIIDAARRLADELGHPVQANAYVTPPQSRGFSAHYDVHDVFVLQVAGEKDWTIHPPVHPWPLRDQPWGARRAQVESAAAGEPVLSARLAPGDCLYLPRGFLHAATARGQVSAHLTIGIHTWTAHGVAERLSAAALRHAAADAAGRAPLPLGVDVGDPDALADAVAEARERLVSAIRAVPAQEVADALLTAARESRRGAPLPPLAQAAAIRDAGPDTPVVPRDGLHLRTRTRPDGDVELTGRGIRAVVPAAQEAGLEPLLSGSASRAGDLPLPGDDAVGLVRRLLSAGVVVPAER